MVLRKRKSQPLIVLGMFSLVLGNLSQIASRWLAVPAGLTDGAMGLFYGIAIGLFFWSFRQNSRRDAC